MFSPYEKIEENLLSRGLTQAHYRQMHKAEWVVTEKIHGANFCVILDNQGIAYAKRKAVLAPDDEFFDYKNTVDSLETAFLQIHE
jgi:hypothetical protein